MISILNISLRPHRSGHSAEFSLLVPKISINVLARLRERQVDSIKTFPKIGFMQVLGAGKLDLERLEKTVRQHRHSSLLSCPLVQDNFAARVINLLEAQTRRLHQPQACERALVQPRRQHLVLARRGHSPVDGQARQRRLHFRRAHFRRMTVILEMNESTNFVRMARLGSDAVMPYRVRIKKLGQEFLAFLFLSIRLWLCNQLTFQQIEHTA